MFKRLFGKKTEAEPATHPTEATVAGDIPVATQTDGARAGVGQAHDLVNPEYLRENLKEEHIARANLVFQERERRYKEFRARKG